MVRGRRRGPDTRTDAQKQVDRAKAAAGQAEALLLDVLFMKQLEDAGLPLPIREYPFAHPRKWRADNAWPDYRILFEREGAVYIAGRHTRGPGYVSDVEKYNAAQLLGWLVVRATTSQVKAGDAVQMVRRALEVRGWTPKGEAPAFPPTS